MRLLEIPPHWASFDLSASFRRVGRTQVPQHLFHDWLRSIASRFTPDKYDLLTHNCNNFSSEASLFLTGTDIPEEVTGLPQEFLNSPLGQQFAPMLRQMSQAQGGGASQGFVPWGSDELQLPPCPSPEKINRQRRLSVQLVPPGKLCRSTHHPRTRADELHLFAQRNELQWRDSWTRKRRI